MGPAPTQLLHDALDYFHRTGGMLVGRPQPRTQQQVAGENVQRQIAVAVVVAVEEPFRLMAVNRDVGGVQVEHDLGRGRGVRFQVEVNQQPIDRLSRVADLVIAPRAAHQLQPIQRALARQRFL